MQLNEFKIKKQSGGVWMPLKTKNTWQKKEGKGSAFFLPIDQKVSIPPKEKTQSFNINHNKTKQPAKMDWFLIAIFCIRASNGFYVRENIKILIKASWLGI